jgi:acylphosphatase
MNKQIHVYYSGTVQGVGFRFTVERLAQDISVVGWVRNLPDGRAEVFAEGSDEDLKDFLGEIKRQFSGYIRDEDISWSEATGEFKDFGIKF